jgi:putative transposase
MPFAVRAVQVDGDSEFFAEFEAVCQSRGIKLFELPSKSRKLNGAVERLTLSKAATTTSI